MKELGEVKVNLESIDGKHYKYEVGERLRISEATLDDDLGQQPEEYAWCSVLAAKAKTFREHMEYQLEEFEYNLDLKIREGAAKDDKLTEGKIKALIRTDSKRISMVNALIEAKEKEEILMAIREGLAQRKDCLISFSANHRAQMDVGLNVKKKGGK